MTTTEMNRVIEGFNLLSFDEKEYIADIIQKQLIEYRREQIADRAAEARENFKKGKVKTGSVKDLFRDLEND
jgi:hypothetical protein